MSRRDIGTDDPRVKVRPSKRSRPRTKVRPDWGTKPIGQVIGIDRGRYLVRYEGLDLRAVLARELKKGSVVVGDRVRMTGDLSGRVDTLARIVATDDRNSVLRRSLEDAPDQKGEKIIVANAEIMVIVTALADPPPRMGMIDRCLVAAHEAGMRAVLCLTKADLAPATEFLEAYADFDVTTVVTSVEADCQGLDELKEILAGHFSVLVGHSGVGKSTLINALIPQAERVVGVVNQVTGRGRHTSTSSRAFELPGGGWIVDTPGVRSFGLGHVDIDDVLGVFPDVAEASRWCLPLCTHLEDATSCALDAWSQGKDPFVISSTDEAANQERQRRSSRVASVRRLLDAVAGAMKVSKAAR